LLRFLDHTELDIHIAGRNPQLVAEAATYTIHIKLEGQISMPPAGLEPVIPQIEATDIHLRHHEDRKRPMAL
jgi:hypothetical protein